MAIQHQITLQTLSDKAKKQLKFRIGYSILVGALFGLIAWVNNPFDTKSNSLLNATIGGISLGYAAQAVCFAMFNFTALLGDDIVRNKSEFNKCIPIGEIHFFAGILMMFGLIFTFVGSFENGFYIRGTIACIINLLAWFWIYKNTIK